MDYPHLSKSLTKIYNTFANEWIVDNFVSEPFDFRVFVRKGDSSDTTDYVVEVYTDRPIPHTLYYKDKDAQWADGIHYSSVIDKLKELAQYVDNFGQFKKTLGVQLMDLDNEL